MNRVPLSVIGGYLGAGKTTLINGLLALDPGLRLAVLVNDFGAINIDAALLKTASEDTIELTNGCICCTMSGDLFFAVGDLLDRENRPDHILVEASGIADPASIADVAIAEKELRYGGIVTVVDGLNVGRQLADARIAGQVRSQFGAADLIAVSKTAVPDIAPLIEGALSPHCAMVGDVGSVAAFLFEDGISPRGRRRNAQGHQEYVNWTDPQPRALTRGELEARLSNLPPGLLRLKGLIPDDGDGFWEVHVVGAQCDIRRRKSVDIQGLVAIGLGRDLRPADLRDWWEGAAPPD